MQKEALWLAHNIKMKTCSTFVPSNQPSSKQEEGDEEEGNQRCCCGRVRSQHNSRALEQPGEVVHEWTSETCCTEVPTNAFGDVVCVASSDADSNADEENVMKVCLAHHDIPTCMLCR